MPDCVESNTDANMQRALWVPSFLISTPQIGTNSPGWFLRQPERVAQARRRSVIWLLFASLQHRAAKMKKRGTGYYHLSLLLRRTQFT